MTQACGAVLVHGLWHGAWCWSLVQRRLEAAGVASTAVQLPMTGLVDDAAAVRQALDRAGRPVVLVGHSYGGAVSTVAGDHPAVRRLVYLAGFQLDVGESISRVLPESGVEPTRLSAALRFSDGAQQVSIDAAMARQLLFGQAPESEADAAVARIRPVARTLFSGTADAVAWRAKPSTYAVCAEDLAVAPDLQRAMSRRATQVIEWPSDHSPLLSHPDLVSDLLVSATQER